MVVKSLRILAQKGKLSVEQTIVPGELSWQGDRFIDEGNSLFPHYITRLSDLNGSPFALGDYSKSWGSNVEVLNLSSGGWSVRESYPYSDWITHYATVSMPNEIIVFGGWDGTLRWGSKSI